MASNEMPLWMREIAEMAQRYQTYIEQAEEAQRLYMPLIRAAQQYAEQARRAQARTAPLLPYLNQVALAMDAGMAQLEAAIQHYDSALAQFAPAGPAAGAGIARQAKVLVDAGTAREVLTATVEEAARKSVDRLVFALVFLWLVALAMPAAQMKLPPEVQEILNTLYATVGLALAVTWRINDNRKR